MKYRMVEDEETDGPRWLAARKSQISVFLIVFMVAVTPIALIRIFLFSRTQSSGNLPLPDCT